MISVGTRTVKKINGIEYLYYMYNDYTGKQITRYCGRNGTLEADIKSLKIELENLTEIRYHLDERIKDVRDNMKKKQRQID